ncbi:MAG: hypothetical protein JWL58_7353 [Streptosporangiaceae bacterium]|jgi:hypothetical protein|nr:hypothetical protein [Streptosporangiaceae bacterium]
MWAARAELLARLGVTAPTPEEAVARLPARAGRTVPDFLPIARHEEGDSFYEASYDPSLTAEQSCTPSRRPSGGNPQNTRREVRC